MSMHTPGPWSGRHHSNPVLIQGCDDAGLSIAFNTAGGHPSYEEFKANARLIAAAPDLLEALQKLVELAKGPPGGVSLSMKFDAVDAADKAIAKATGTSP